MYTATRMSFTSAGDDVTREAPADAVGSSFDLLSSQIESLESLLGMGFEDYDEFVDRGSDQRYVVLRIYRGDGGGHVNVTN